MSLRKSSLFPLLTALAGLAAGFALAVLVLPALRGAAPLRLEPGPTVVFVSPQGTAIRADYGRLAAEGPDRPDLAFVRLQLPDGRVLLLPQALSASGARYSDEREWQWWGKGDLASLARRGPDGGWTELYPDCRAR
jgi:hypothetical protein